jgi:hypothetical protein
LARAACQFHLGRKDKPRNKRFPQPEQQPGAACNHLDIENTPRLSFSYIMKDLHNPQNFTPEDFGGPDGFRLLTQTEIAVLSDANGRPGNLAAANLREYIKPQLFSESNCRWQTVLTPWLSMASTYRTQAPELADVDPETSEPGISFDYLAAGVNEGVAVCHGLATVAGWNTDQETGLPILEAAGRWAGYVVGTKLALVHSEVTEALEGHRKGLPDDKLPHRSMLQVELADAMIRLNDLAGLLGFEDMGECLVEKLRFNLSRADHKPANRAKTGGKVY